MKARKIPVVIDFFEYQNNNTDVLLWVESLGIDFYSNFVVRPDGQLTVITLEGTSYAVTTDDMIIMGVNKEFYPCKKDIFEKTYEVLSNEVEYFRSRC